MGTARLLNHKFSGLESGAQCSDRRPQGTGAEPTRMYSRRVTEVSTRFMSVTIYRIKSPALVPDEYVQR